MVVECMRKTPSDIRFCIRFAVLKRIQELTVYIYSVSETATSQNVISLCSWVERMLFPHFEPARADDCVKNTYLACKRESNIIVHRLQMSAVQYDINGIVTFFMSCDGFRNRSSQMPRLWSFRTVCLTGLLCHVCSRKRCAGCMWTCAYKLKFVILHVRYYYWPCPSLRSSITLIPW